MRTNYNENNSCPCCNRHCPAENPQCPRGKQFFSSGERSGRTESPHPGEYNAADSQNDIIHLLLKCGHYLHHGADITKSDELLSFLSADEKETLASLLNKCIQHWI